MKSPGVLRIFTMWIQTYDELLALAEKGDNSKVDIYVQSLRNKMDVKEEVKEEAFYAEMPGDLPAFCFGHGAGKQPGMRMRVLQWRQIK